MTVNSNTLHRPFNKRRLKKNLGLTVSFIILVIGAIAMLIPFLWMLSTSLKDLSDTFVYPPKFFGKTIVWENYANVNERLNFLGMFGNTVFVTVMVLVGQIITSTMAGFAFSYLNFRGREHIFRLYLLAIMIPFHVLLVPTFVLLRDMRMLNSLWALILPCVVSPFGAFLMRQAYMSIPRALGEAAKIDGCSPWKIYTAIFLPLSVPTMTTLAIFTFVATWNDFLRPLIFLSSNKQMTLTLGIYAMQGNYSTDWGVLMATVTLSLLPVVIVFLSVQDLFVEGVAISGMKS
ncbi:MAG: carbohydrate ABC transporter permease [Eubacteriales bacterium]|nr:carbohydrate ABC transporter permease [Eubacteriales bacterium]